MNLDKSEIKSANEILQKVAAVCRGQTNCHGCVAYDENETDGNICLIKSVEPPSLII